ncbi:sulfatase [Opitutales bacterium]|nr:sulfatase [Opitutales bacterium]
MKFLPFITFCAFFFSTMIQAQDERSNVLWIYLEDVSGWFSCYGETLIDTPNIDQLANEGIRFDRFYTSAGVCSATRSAILTGMMQTSIGAHNHRSCRAKFRGENMGEYDRNVLDILTIPEIFRKNGYWTANHSKDDYNFAWDSDKLYDYGKQSRLNPDAFISGEMLEGRVEKPFFLQVQLSGGKGGSQGFKVVQPEQVKVPPYYPDIPSVRSLIAEHYNCLLKTDRQVGQIVGYLKEKKLYENTRIFLFSDHGMKLHRHKQFLYEGGIHMPLIVSGAGIEKGGVRDDLVSGIDLSAASLATAGIKVPDYMEGRDFLSKTHKPREFVVAARDRCDYTIDHIRAIVTKRFKYLKNYLTDRPYMQPSYKDPWQVSKDFRRLMAERKMNEVQKVFFSDKRPAEELYDLENDPLEIHNLATDPKFKAELKRHRKLLAEWIQETGDKGQLPESDLGLLSTLKRWGDKCINPEYDRVRHLLKSKK